jgi:hypothetical protein
VKSKNRKIRGPEVNQCVALQSGHASGKFWLWPEQKTPVTGQIDTDMFDRIQKSIQCTSTNEIAEEASLAKKK